MTGYQPQYSCSSRRAYSTAQDGYLLIEVVLAMTILAVSGTVIIQSMRMCIDYSRAAERYSTALYLTQIRLLELELQYTNKYDGRQGSDNGRYDDYGQPEYWWESDVEFDSDRLAYTLKVTTFWWYKNQKTEFSMETIAPAARIRRDLLR